ncbi:MAG: C1 family peptidase [Deltaproteobacteria bacterium]|nr:C1 family peptidase [Deltaproteobacteria bacterium]
MTMRLQSLVTAAAIVLAATAVSADASRDEIARVRAEIKANGLAWTAGETSMTLLSPEQRGAMLIPLAQMREERELFPGQPARRPPPPARAVAFAPEDPVFTWRDVNGEDWTTPITNQGQCGSCTVFAAIGVVEGMANVTFGDPDLDLDLSEQNLLSCGAISCAEGGTARRAFRGLVDNGGVPDEACHPYTATDGVCTDACADIAERRVPLTGWDYVVPHTGHPHVPPTVEQVKAALANGPLATSMIVYSDFMAYQSGVYAKTPSATEQGGHEVVIIGWNDANDSWYAKNSWGATWGDQGFFEIKRGEAEFAGSDTAWATVDVSAVAGSFAVSTAFVKVTLKLGSDKTATRVVTLTRTSGTAALPFRVELGEDAPWLSVAPADGGLTGDAGVDLTLTFDESAYDGGLGTVYENVFVVGENGVSRTVRAALGLSKPVADAGTDTDTDTGTAQDTDTGDLDAGADSGNGSKSSSACGCTSVGRAPRSFALVAFLFDLLF